MLTLRARNGTIPLDTEYPGIRRLQLSWAIRFTIDYYDIQREITLHLVYRPRRD